ncbi:SDR family NAD(P)-dependent oxidoreductase [Myxococcota bacterium]|nr:SDR family NAD(P)-dependent oxidoreductase [Myxococcota bacterium]
MTIRLDGRVALVTGAGNGIGRAHAQCLAARGARVLVNNRHHEEPDPADRSADQVVAAIRETGGEAVADHSDVGEPGAGSRMVEHALDVFGQLDIVIANAGVAHVGIFHKLSLEVIRETVAINVLGTLELVHAALPGMRSAGWGRILVTHSTSALGDVTYAAYAASKSAMDGFVRCIDLENRGRNVLANALVPFAHTAMTDRHFESGVFSREASPHVSPDKVAELAALLVSDACPVSGELIAVVGGTVRRLELLQGRGLELDPREISAERILEGFSQVVEIGQPISYASGGEMLLDLIHQSAEKARE